MSNYMNNMNIPPVFNASTNHPLIPNANEYMFYKKYVSIHSEDRDINKYPNSSEFEIELPEDYLNVATVRLANFAFPSNYYTFSSLLSNITMTFQITNPYNPSIYYGDNQEDYINDPIYLYYGIHYAIVSPISIPTFTINIEEGYYTPTQMVNELTNQFNTVVTNYLIEYFNSQNNVIFDWTKLIALLNNNGYTDFVINYNEVTQKIWFGNTTSGFTLTNSSQVSNLTTSLYNQIVSLSPSYIGTYSIANNLTNPNICIVPTNKNVTPFTSWGLPGYLGLLPLDITSINSSTYPSFFYENNNWLEPNTTKFIGSQNSYSYIECPFKINLLGPSYFYMELDGFNCIDETSPYTNNVNGQNAVVNSSFAKINIPSTPISSCYYDEFPYYKYFSPPAERIRKLKVKLRYHNGNLVNFGNTEYSFTIEFSSYTPQQLRKYKLNGPQLVTSYGN